MGCRTTILYHPSYARRGFTSLRRTWNRYQLFLGTLGPFPLGLRTPLVEAPAATENDLLTVHSADYVDLIQELDLCGQGKLDGSTPAWHGMYARAERVVGGTLLAADLVASGYADHAFNPAGGQHHAHLDRGGGFCVFNDVVAAVRRFQAAGFKRIAVLDLDGHHGDGTESLLAEEPVLTLSLHQFGNRTYPGTGRVERLGDGAGKGFNCNVPLARGTGDAAYLAAFAEVVEPLLRAYRPEVLIVEFGTDGHAADPLLRLRLSTRAYDDLARRVHTLAHELCHGRLLVVGGGGYEPEYVVRCWVLLLAELSGMSPDEAHPEAEAWLREPSVEPDEEADTRSLVTARQARALVFPMHGLGAR